MRTITIENLANEGMTADIRDETTGAVKLSKHFDIISRTKTLTPYRSQVEGDSASATDRLTDFLIGQSGILYGGGNDTVTGKVKIWQLGSGSTWVGATGGVDPGTNTMVAGIFVLYHDVIYGSGTGGKVWSYDTVGATFTNASTTLNGACTTNGVVHSKDDILYMAYTNTGNVPTIATNNAGSWNTTALALPNRYIITSLCEYGNYLAIGCKPRVGGTGNSVVYLWDRDSTLNTISEVIDFGLGDLTVLDQVEGQLIGVSLRQDYTANITTGLATRFVFRNYSGATANVFRELIASSSTGIQLISGRKFNAGRLYFLAAIEIDSTLQMGVWCVSKNKSGRWIVWLDRVPNNDTAVTAGSLVGFFVYGDYVLISWNDSGYRLTQTSATSTAFATSSTIETTINPGIGGSFVNERSANKQLQILAFSYDPIPTSGQVVIQTKVDGGSWTTARTETTVGRTISEISASEASFTAGHEYQFRVKSTGGVVITGLKYKYEVLKSLI